MNKRAFQLIWVIGFTLFYTYYVYADTIQAEVIPVEVRAGDPFFIKVTNIKSSRNLSASFKNNKLHFNSWEDCYLAIGAVDIKTEPGIYPLQIKFRKKKLIREIKVLETIFPKQEISLSDEKVFLDRKNLKRVKKENKRLKTIFRKVTRKLWDGDFILPLENEITTDFGTERIINHNIKSLHTGVDIRGEEGEEIMASNRGKVVFKKELFFGGKTIIIDHGGGIYTIYMHLSKYNVRLHEIVPKGFIIGYVGSTGRSTGSHLHFGVKISKINVNPISLFELEL